MVAAHEETEVENEGDLPSHTTGKQQSRDSNPGLSDIKKCAMHDSKDQALKDNFPFRPSSSLGQLDLDQGPTLGDSPVSQSGG